MPSSQRWKSAPAQKARPAPVMTTAPGEVWSDGRVFMMLGERRGLLHAATLRKEVGREVPYFAALADAEPGEYGLLLESAPAAR